jgi:adenosylmethionine-8-amino-7-oxononanoate aminotransferase
MYIEDSKGRKYLDMSGGAAVSCVGHAHPEVTLALKAQIDSLSFAHTSFFTNEPQEELAAIIASRFRDPGARVYFLAGGSEANETAMKLAWQYWVAQGEGQKKIIISRDHSYHGNTFGALSISGNAGRRHASAAPLLEWPRISPCYAYRYCRNEETLADYGKRVADELQTAIRKCGKSNVAAFIAEPIVGSSLGVVGPVAGYFNRVRRICDENEILFVADEIMCGSGRTGTFFAHQHENIVPDIVTLAKGIGGGYMPLGAVVMAEHVGAQLSEAGFAHGHTYVGHAAACAAGVAVQRVIEQGNLLSRTRQMGEALMRLLKDAFQEHHHVGNIRGRGLFAAVEFVADRESKAGFENAPRLAERIRLAAMEQGLICYPGSIMVDGRCVPHVMVAPPMIANEEQLADGVSRLLAAVNTVL